MKRKKIAAANWKMNTTVPEGIGLLRALSERTLEMEVEVVICAPATHLYALNQEEMPKNLFLGAQNMYDKDKGAFTGEISSSMLQSIGVTHVIIGHSERREYFEESNEFLRSKLLTALQGDLTPIFCCGESLDVRKSGEHEEFVIGQLRESFHNIESEDIAKIVIAYEPIWAIGTGETASPEQAQEMHASIRQFLSKEYATDIANAIPILYGGSVKPGNAKELFQNKDVDGGLVGGASLDAESFASIINSFP